MRHVLLRSAGVAVPRLHRGLSNGLPYRIRAPLAKLVDRKKDLDQTPTSGGGGLGDGEKLETNESGPDYVGLALRSRVYDMVHETPYQYASGLSAKLNATVHLKREDLLPSFSFKLRGAYNQLAYVNEDTRPSEVITYSIGSQGHSVAVAARALGMRATVVMPERAPAKRRAAIERAGAQVVVAGSTLSDAQAHAEAYADSHADVAFLRPHDDPLVIAGQATCGLEVIKQVGGALEGQGKLNAIFVVAGGSSLLAGIASVFKQIMPHTKVIGVEASSADLLHRSLLTGHRLSVPEPAHFVDGASVKQLGAEVRAHARRHGKAPRTHGGKGKLRAWSVDERGTCELARMRTHSPSPRALARIGFHRISFHRLPSASIGFHRITRGRRKAHACLASHVCAATASALPLPVRLRSRPLLPHPMRRADLPRVQ